MGLRIALAEVEGLPRRERGQTTRRFTVIWAPLQLAPSGRVVDTYASCEAFLKAFDPGKSACLIGQALELSQDSNKLQLIDAYLPGMSGLELLEKLRSDGHPPWAHRRCR
jgi:CheY-like chemotaxis protein